MGILPMITGGTPVPPTNTVALGFAQGKWIPAHVRDDGHLRPISFAKTPILQIRIGRAG